MKDLKHSLNSLIFVACLLQSPCSAQAYQNQQSENMTPLAGQPLPLTPVSLPDLPEYTGKAKLARAVAFASTGQIEKSVTLTYETKESADKILDWYRSALSMYRWTMQSEQPDVLVAIQNRSGNTCNIYCDDESASGCKLHISYSFAKQAN